MKRIAPLFLLISTCLVLWKAFIFPVTAPAHPHMFIVQQINIVFDEKGLAGIKVTWIMDDMFASMIAQDHDLNGNGRLDAKEVLEVKENAFNHISEFNYFTHIKIDGTPFPVKFITDFNANLKDRRLTYEFFIPCHVTATNQYKKVSVGSYDPTYYTAIFFADKSPVKLTSQDPFELKTAIREDPDTKIYFDMIHPWTLFLEFRKKR